MTMPRTITAILRDMDTVENHKRLKQEQKEHALRMFQKELDEATGQGQLDLPPGGQVPVQPGQTVAKK